MTYLPDKTGRYSVGIKYGGDDIPLSPYRIRVSPAGDASKCQATGKFVLFSHCKQVFYKSTGVRQAMQTALLKAYAQIY